MAFGRAEGGGRVEGYLGLQYGSLLDGELRFMPPTAPTESWGEAIKDASRFHAVCPQPPAADLVARAATAETRIKWKALATYLQEQSEECLRLNIYVPATEAGGLLLLELCCC